MDDETVELVNLRLISTVPVEKPELEEPPPEGDAEAGHREANFDGEWLEVAVLDRERMGEGSEVTGPRSWSSRSRRAWSGPAGGERWTA